MNEHGHQGQAAPAGGHGHAEGEFGHGGVGKYLAVFVALCILTAISFAVGNSPWKETVPPITWAMMMVVSCAKAMLVILFFMHLKWEANWKYVLTIPASIMSIFLLLMLVPDIGLRGRNYSEERLLHAAEPNSAAGKLGHDEPAQTHAGEKPAAGHK